MGNNLKVSYISEMSTAQVSETDGDQRGLSAKRDEAQGGPWRSRGKALLCVRASCVLSLPLPMASAYAVHLAASFKGEQEPLLSAK